MSSHFVGDSANPVINDMNVEIQGMNDETRTIISYEL